MKARFFLFLFIVFFVKAYADVVYEPDDLSQSVSSLTGTKKLRALEQLTDYYMNNNLDSCYHYLLQLKKYAEETGNRHYESVAYSSLGLYWFYSGAYDKAQNFLQKAIQLQKQTHDTAGLAHSYNVLAGVYGENGEYKKSIKILYQALKIYEQQHNIDGLEKVYNNWGYLYMKLDNYPKAMTFYKKALHFIEKYKLHKNRGILYSDMGICYKEFGQYDSALYCYNMALKEYRKQKMFNDIPMLYQSFGNLYAFRLGNRDSALHYFKKGIELARRYDPNSLVELYLSLGQFQYQQKNNKESLSAYGKALLFAQRGDLNGQKQAYYGLFRLNKKMNRLPQALAYYQKYTDFKDSIDNKESRIAISRLEEKYKNEKNLVYIQKLQARQKTDRRLKIILFLGVVFLALLLAFVVYGIVQRKKRYHLEKKLLRAEKEKVDEKLRYQNRQLASQALIMMQKNKMLHLLYDSLRNVPKDPEKVTPYLARVKHQIKQNLKSEKDWEIFKLYFEQVNKTFFKKLKAINSALTQNDLRLAALIKLGLNIKEVAAVLSLSPNSIKGARHRLRVKLGLANEDDLGDFISRID